MKQKFALVRSVAKFSTDTVIFHLFVGSSSRDQIKLHLVEQFCDYMGYFLRIEDEDTCYLLELKARELRPESRLPMLWIKSVSWDIQRFHRELMKSNLDVIEKNILTTRANRDMLHVLDADYFFNHSQISTIPRANQSIRKNLSQETEGIKDTLLGAAIWLSAIFLLDVLVSNVFGL